MRSVVLSHTHPPGCHPSSQMIRSPGFQLGTLLPIRPQVPAFMSQHSADTATGLTPRYRDPREKLRLGFQELLYKEACFLLPFSCPVARNKNKKAGAQTGHRASAFHVADLEGVPGLRLQSLVWCCCRHLKSEPVHGSALRLSHK